MHLQVKTKECLWEQAYSQFRLKYWNEKGIIREDPMTKQERRGKIKLQKRVQEGTIEISQTDKSQELTISSRESYSKQGEVHVARDKEVSWK